MNTFRSAVRGAMITGQAAVRGGVAQATPKMDFGSKLGAGLAKAADSAPPNVAVLRARLDGLHTQIRTATDAVRLADLVDEYVMVVALITTGTAALYGGSMPGGAILSAAVSSVGILASKPGSQNNP